jgi:hypothetical protein
MRYLLVILEDDARIQPDPELFEWVEEEGITNPDPARLDACLDRILDVVDQDALGKRAVMELPATFWKEARGSHSTDLQTHFNFAIKGTLE